METVRRLASYDPRPTARTQKAYEKMLAADNAWQAEIVKEAKLRRMWPGDFRYHPDAEALPGYAAFKAAREEWHAAWREADAAAGRT